MGRLDYFLDGPVVDGNFVLQIYLLSGDNYLYFSENLPVNLIDPVLDKIVVKPQSCLQGRINPNELIPHLCQHLFLAVYVDHHLLPLYAPKLGCRFPVVGSQHLRHPLIPDAERRVLPVVADPVVFVRSLYLPVYHHLPIQLHHLKGRNLGTRTFQRVRYLHHFLECLSLLLSEVDPIVENTAVNGLELHRV